MILHITQKCITHIPIKGCHILPPNFSTIATTFGGALWIADPHGPSGTIQIRAVEFPNL